MSGAARIWPEAFPRVVKDLDTRLPALIEASAGTGKTYAIEHLCLRLLAENPDWKLESLLLLSFTEKTAGELRDRIRERLKRESVNRADWNGAERERFRDAWLRCEEISIHTLHGFCHSALRRHALRNGALLDAEVLDDAALLREALDSLLRGAWARDPDGLRELRGALEMDAGEKWRERILRLALAYHPDRNDRLEPSPDPQALPVAEAALAASCFRLLGAVSAVERGSLSVAEHRRSFGLTKTGRTALGRDAFARVFDAAAHALPLPDPEKVLFLSAFFAASFNGAHKAVKSGFAACLSDAAADRAEWRDLAQACEDLRGAALKVAEAREDRRLGLRAEAARALRLQLEAEKRRRGALGYDDMVSKLVKSLREDGGFAEALRRPYNACIVDEFQDTDPLQWDLLRILCLDASDPLPLFLVGDPKQAIYGFRGGDLRTYLEARALLWEKARLGEAQGFGLVENWRSRPAMIAGLNAVFSDEAWFGHAEEIPAGGAWHLPERSTKIAFTPALPPAAKTERAPGDPAIFRRDFSFCQSKGQAEQEIRAWIADGILRLTRGGTDLRLGERDESPLIPLFGDIAVLTRTNFEALALEKHLRRRGIPARVRRRGGVLHGPLADAVRLLLGWIEDAGSPSVQARILLLPFLRRAGEDWPRGKPPEFPALVRRWSEFALAGRWPEFFHSVLYESGFLYRLAAATGYGSEARSLRALCRLLAEEGVKCGAGPRDLCARFDALRRGEEDEDETGALTGDEDENRVSILTLHLSKGLEFPVVFLAAAGEARKPEFFTVRDDEGFRHVLDASDTEAQALHRAQALEEDKRLFYVGLTRAKDRLYVPLLPAKFTRSGSGPLGGFAAIALRNAAEALPGLFAEDASSEEAAGPAVGSAEDGKNAEALAWPEKDVWAGASAKLWARRRGLSSYSQLARRAPAPVLEEDGSRAHPEEGAPDPLSDEETAPQVSAADLPPGAHTGNALHALLETLDFSAAARAANPEALLADARLRESVSVRLREHGLDEAFAPAAARVLWNTLRMPLPDPAGGKSFRLADVSDRRAEMEFLFPFSATRGQSAPVPEGAAIRGGFLWGFMDLIFRHEGRYYLLDWKSNLLDRYDERSVGEDMLRHRYDLQYRLYAVALHKWLAVRLGNAYDPAAHFGGIFYLYLRGASPDRFSGFSHRPSPADLIEHWPLQLGEVLGLSPGDAP